MQKEEGGGGGVTPKRCLKNVPGGYVMTMHRYGWLKCVTMVSGEGGGGDTHVDAC